MASLKKSARRALKLAPGTRTVVNRYERRGDGERVKASGLFDPVWYSEQVGEVFENIDEAIDHYLRKARTQWFSPCPLIEPEWFDGRKGEPKFKPQRGMQGLLRYLVRGPGGDQVHPWFDDEVWTKLHPEAAKHPGRALGHFMENAQTNTPMPGQPDLTWGEAWTILRRSHMEWVRQQGLRSPRFKHTWDQAREDAYRDRVRRVVLPQAAESSPLVSIVLPVKNRPTQVLEAVLSVVQQTLSDWELIVVDDGSTDMTADAVRHAAAGDPRIRIITGPGTGVCPARNAGIAAARAPWVAFIDSDNTWNPDHLLLSLRGLMAEGRRVGYSTVEFHSARKTRWLDFQGTKEHLLVGNYVDMNTLVVATDVLRQIGGFSEDLKRMVDWDLIIRLSDIEPPLYMPFIGAVVHEDPSLTDRITVTQPASWGTVVLDRHLIDWAALDTLEARDPGLTSILMPTFEDFWMTTRAVRALLNTRTGMPDDHRLEVIVLVNGGRHGVWTLLNTLIGEDRRVKLIRLPKNENFALGSNVPLSASHGSTVVFLNNDTVVQPGWLAPLHDALEDPDVLGAQPLLLYPDMMVQCAGTIFPGGNGLPTHFLTGYPASTATALGRYPVKAVTAAALAMRASDAIALRGFDTIFVNGSEDIDLCLRAAERNPGGHFVVDTTSVVVHDESKTPGRGAHIDQNRAIFMSRWAGKLPPRDDAVVARAGLRIAHFNVERTTPGRPALAHPVLVRDPRLVSSGPAAGKPSLRWSIITSAPSGPTGREWGDVYYAEGVADALRRLGQDVVVDRREQSQRSSASIEDVRLVLLGLDAPVTRPGRVNMLWVISHPELVTNQMLTEPDVVFAASITWSERMSKACGREVRPLFQATDATLFNPSRSEPDTGAAALFVGNSRNVYRPIVHDAITGGVPISVYGSRWNQFIDAERIVSDHVANSELGALYRSAGVVLNDHWDDMRAEGFISNRLFDAVASGARVVSDDVPGLSEAFGDAVRTYSSPEELAHLCGPGRDESFPDDAGRVANAARMAAEHSFDARAVELLDAAIQAREVQLGV